MPSQPLHQPPLWSRTETRSPVLWFFVAVYFVFVALGLLSAASETFAYVAMSVGIVLLLWLISGLTEKLELVDLQVRQPGLELGFACVVFLVFEFVRIPAIRFGAEWSFTSILFKEAVLFALPCLILGLRRYSFSQMGLTRRNWRRHLGIGGVVLACLAVPSALTVSNTASLLLTGQLNPGRAVILFLVLFVHNVALSGLPEEFFFRGLVQSRLSVVLNSKLGGILIASLFFGLIHTEDIMRWYQDATLAEALCRAFFLQGFLGIVFGTLWERTHSLIPGVVVHSGINALNNLGSVVWFSSF